MHYCSLEIKNFHYTLLINIQKLIYNFLINFTDYIKITGPIFLGQKQKKFTLLRSPFIHKKSQDHYEISNYKLLISFQTKDLQLLILILNYIQKMLIINIELKINITTFKRLN